MSATQITTEELLRSRTRVPQNVVYRVFAKETVILNLESGLYHGVNPTGGRMLEVLEKGATLRECAATLAAEFGVPAEELEVDVCEFCSGLAERGLLILDRD